MNKENNDKRIVFLDYLRAIACLLVVFGHIYLVGPNDPRTVRIWVPTVSTYIFGPDPNSENPYGIALNYLTAFTGIGVGALGVGIFFLISGFVILRTLDREPWKQFLVRRAFRIYPASVVASLLSLAAVAAFCFFTGARNPLSLKAALSTGFLVEVYTRTLVTNPVVWTLGIEVLFYIVMGIAAANVRRIERTTILGMSIACLLAASACDAIPTLRITTIRQNLLLEHFAVVLTNIDLLFVGSMIYRSMTDGWPRSCWLFIGAAISIYFAGDISHNILSHGAPTGIDWINASFALAIFCVALKSGMKWRWIRPLSWVGKVSYPLYLVHIPLGWIALVVFAQMGVGIHLSGVGALVLVTACAWLMHISIELPFQEAGRRIANWLFGRPSVDIVLPSSALPVNLNPAEPYPLSPVEVGSENSPVA